MMVLSTGMEAAAGATCDELELSCFSVLTRHSPVADGERTQPWTSQLTAQQSAQRYTSASCISAHSALCSEVTCFLLGASFTETISPEALLTEGRDRIVSGLHRTNTPMWSHKMLGD